MIASLQQTLSYSRMRRQGISPEMIQKGIVQKTQEATEQVISELLQRQQLVEQQIRLLQNKLRELDPFSDISLGTELLEENLRELKENKNAFSTVLKEKEEMLEKQQLEIKKTVNIIKQLLESTESNHEATLYRLGQRLTLKIARDQ